MGNWIRPVVKLGVLVKVGVESDVPRCDIGSGGEIECVIRCARCKIGSGSKIGWVMGGTQV